MTDQAAHEVDTAWESSVEGRDVGSGVSIIRERTDQVGAGPRLHRHPYRETFVILRGRARFTIGDRQREGCAGDVLVVLARASRVAASMLPSLRSPGGDAVARVVFGA